MNISNKTLTTLIVVLAPLVLGAVMLFSTSISLNNREAALRAQFNAKQQASTVDYDAMWKIISQTAQVPKQYSADFKDAYSGIIQSGSGTDSNAVRSLFAVATGMKPPVLDSSLYRKVQDVIESERTKFANTQKSLLDIKREHDSLRTTWPGTMFVHTTPLEVKLVTSTKTQKAFETGVDDDTNLFKSN